MQTAIVATRRRVFLRGLILLALAPVVAVAALAIYVWISNRVPQEGALDVRIEPQVVLPWQDTHFFITVRERPTVSTPPRSKIVDVLFFIDVSGSMLGSLPAMARAADQAARQMAGSGGSVRLSLVKFDTESRTLVPWTEDASRFAAGLSDLSPITVQNDMRKPLQTMRELLGTTRLGARRAVVFYTDGGLAVCPSSVCPGGPMPPSEIADAARALRGQGVEFYSVGPPGLDTDSLMLDVTGASSHVFTSADARDLAANFEAVTGLVTDSRRTGARLFNRVDGRYFTTPLEGTAWTLDPTGALSLEVGALPPIGTTYAHPLRGTAAGVWNVGVDPAAVMFVNESGALIEAAASRRPKVFVITWLMLLWPLLPFLLLLLVRSRPQPLAPDAMPHLPLRPPPLPSALPALPPAAPPALGSVPTLFVGLGGAGHVAMRAARSDLKQASAGAEGQPYAFVSMDLDARQQPDALTPFDEWRGYDIDRLVAPAEVAVVAGFIPRVNDATGEVPWFDAMKFQHAARQDLNLTEGAKGDRMLARLALHRWLAAGSLLPDLERLVERLMSLPSPDDIAQVVIVASGDGGVGSGWFVDVARVLRRIARRRQTDGRIAFVPEIVGIITTSGDVHKATNRAALQMELETASLTGEFPRRVTMHPNDGLLDATDSENPFDWTFLVSELDLVSAAAQAGGLSAMLTERAPRRTLLGAALPSPVSVDIRSIHVVPTLIQELVQLDILLRILGPDVLLDIRPTRGGYEPMPKTGADVSRALDAWIGSAPAGTLFEALLRVGQVDATHLQAFARAAATHDPHGVSDWLPSALIVSVNRMLHGHRDSGRSRWSRDWPPTMAVETLRMVAERLSTQAETLTSTDPAPARAMRTAAEQMTSLANALSSWIDTLSEFCTETARHHQALAERVARLSALRGRTHLDSKTTARELEEAAAKGLQDWLLTEDTLSPLRECLFFSTAISGDTARVSFRCCVERATEYATPQEMTAALTRITSSLARSVPVVRIGGALLQTPEREWDALHRSLLLAPSRPDLVVVSRPWVSDRSPREKAAVEKFCAALPVPADHGSRYDAVADDGSAIRRAGVATDMRSLADTVAFIELAERESERLRAKAQQRFGAFVPTLPPRLRIALAHPELFRAFAHAYREGRIQKRPNEEGAQHWVFTDSNQLLTFGADASLAAAAANFVWHARRAASQAPPAPVAGAGDFSSLNAWSERRDALDMDTLVLAVIDVAGP